MADLKRGDDAADHAPKPAPEQKPEPAAERQDAPNYADTVGGGRAEPVDSLNSANDE